MEKKQDNFSEWMNDFSEFLAVESVTPPQHISDRIQEVVYKSLNPSPFLVFAKLAITAIVAGSSTLLFCPQFGLGTKSGGIMPYLMKISPLVCQFGCGAIFLGIGVFGSMLILRPEELRVLKKTRFLQISALSASMLGMLLCLGPVALSALEWWFFGGITGGLISVYGGSWVRGRLITAT